MATWRQPGQPYEVTVGGIVIVCKPLLRGDAMALAEFASKGFETAEEAEALYHKVCAQVQGIDGVDGDIKIALDYQSYEFMTDLFRAILGSGILSDDEVKNSKPLSGGLPPELPTGDAPNAEKDTAGAEA